MIKYFVLLINLVFSIEFDAPFIEKYELENGMTILLSPIYDQPMVYINTLVGAGDMNGGENKSNVAELTGKLLKYENQNYNHDELQEYIDNIASIWTYSDYDYTMFNIEGLKENIEKLISLQSEVLRYPKFNKKYFIDRKTEMLGWQKMSIEDDPGHQKAFHAQNMILGTNINIYYSNSDITLDDIKTFYNSFYYPRNMKLMISGDFNVSHAKILIEKYFGNWKEGGEIKTTEKLISKKSNGINVRFIDSPKLPKAAIRIVMPGLNPTDSDFLSFYSTSQILGVGRNSRIYNSIKSIPGNWDDDYSSHFTWERTYNYLFYEYKSSYKDNDKIYNLIKNEIKNIGINNITGDELQLTKKKVIGSTILNLESPENLNRWVLGELFSGQTIENIINYTNNLKSIPLDDVNSTAKKYWDHENFYLIIFGDKDSTETFLNQFENVEYYERFDPSK